MKAFKKQIGRLRSRLDSRGSSPVPPERSDVLSMQPRAFISDSNILQAQSRDADALALETQHIDSVSHEELVSDSVSLEPRSDDSSVPNVQTKASDITDFMQDLDPDLMEKFGRFRILIVGRANAGKTTILQRICNSTEDPEIYNDRGEKVNFVIEGSTERGIHDINHEMVFKSNQKFVFHDSPGFEAGREGEFENMKNFITERGNTTFLKKRIHAIWYCIPMDQHHRAVLTAEEKFFCECDTSKVPVVVLFTKWDALVTQAFQPEDLHLSLEDQLAGQRQRAEEVFTKRNILGDLCKMKCPPKAFVQLENMDTSDRGCNILLEQTAAALNDQSLQMLLITAQEMNIRLCIQYAVRCALIPYVELRNTTQQGIDLARILASWFPHTQGQRRYLSAAYAPPKYYPPQSKEFEKNLDTIVTESQSHPVSIQTTKAISMPTKTANRWEKILRNGIDLILLLQCSFTLAQSKNIPNDPFSLAVQKYKASGISAQVSKKQHELFVKYSAANNLKEKERLVMDIILHHSFC